MKKKIVGVLCAVIVVVKLVTGGLSEDNLRSALSDANELSQLLQSAIPLDEADLHSVGTYTGESYDYDGKTYDVVEVEGGDRSGERLSNVAVDIGYGDRLYWGLTNEYGQLVYVFADEIVLQDDEREPVNKNGRYYDDEAYVPGTESPDLDQGHVIADSLGGVSNAYNITPQDSTLNRHGDQAYMEKAIREAEGCSHFYAAISYPDTQTQTPSHYDYQYVIQGRVIEESFDNKSPE